MNVYFKLLTFFNKSIACKNFMLHAILSLKWPNLQNVNAHIGALSQNER